MRARRVLLSVAAALCAAPSAHAADALPDLVSDPPVDRSLGVYDGRLLLRLDSFIRNAGAGAVELEAAGLQNGVLTDVKQRIFDENGGISREVPRPGALIRFEPHGGHSHFHLQKAARYSLWTESRSFEVIGAEKAGFCFVDSERIEPTAPTPAAYASLCSLNEPNPLLPLVMGISAGWRDIYGFQLAFQWVDVSALTPGRYRLGSEVDPDDFIIESNEANPVVFQEEVSIVPGHVAQAQTVDAVNPFAPRDLTLGVTSYERPGTPLGPAAFTAASPSCGRLEQPVEGGAAVRWLPGPNCSGDVSFEFSARDANSAFPARAPTAKVTLRLGTRKALSRTRVRRARRGLRVRMRSAYEGRLKATARRRGRRLGSCSVRARAGRAVGCRIRLSRRALASGRVSVTTALLLDGRAVAKRRDPAR